MRDLSLSETLISKAEMDKIMPQAGQPINHYHSNNSRFSYNGFIDSIHPNSIVAREVLVAPSKSMAATEGYSIPPVKTHPFNEGSFDFCARMSLRKTPR